MFQRYGFIKENILLRNIILVITKHHSRIWCINSCFYSLKRKKYMLRRHVCIEC